MNQNEYGKEWLETKKRKRERATARKKKRGERENNTR